MASSKPRDEVHKLRREPLLPVEKKLIAWSLGLGIVLLGILFLIRDLLPGAK